MNAINLDWSQCTHCITQGDDVYVRVDEAEKTLNVDRTALLNGLTQAVDALAERTKQFDRASDEIARLRVEKDTLVAALRSAHHMLTRDYIDDAKMRVVDMCDAAIEAATGRPA